jgi:2-polyprenyl-3-methyl-5-hydroxy-6-metoxy-1,4-benzoquinol methylase
MDEPAASWNNRLKCSLLESRDKWLAEKARGRRVLHLGCTDAPFTQERLQQGTAVHCALEEAAAEITGVDIDVKGLQLLKRHCPRSMFVRWNVEELPPRELANQRFDIIICADMIEHVSNPGLMMANIRDLLMPDGEFIITTINAFAFKPFARALFKREAVHPDHIVYYSFATLKHLCERYNYVIDNQHFMFLYPFRSRLITSIQGPAYRLFPAAAEGIAVVGRADGPTRAAAI